MKNIRFILFILPLFFMLGCSISTDIYVQNLTSEEKLFFLKYKMPVKDLPSYKELDIPYAEDIKTPKEFNKIKNPNSIKFETVDEHTISFNIPGKSTAKIESTSNTRYYEYLESVELEGKKLSLKELLIHSKRKGADYIYQISQ